MVDAHFVYVFVYVQVCEYTFVFDACVVVFGANETAIPILTESKQTIKQDCIHFACLLEHVSYRRTRERKRNTRCYDSQLKNIDLLYQQQYLITMASIYIVPGL